MQIIEVDNESAKMRVCDTSSMKIHEEDFTGILECITDEMLFRQDYYINLNYFAGCNDVSFFNKNGVMHKFSLPVKHRCGCYNLSESERYLVFCDSVILGYDSVKILDIYKNKIIKTYPIKYVNGLEFIHKDKELLISTWEGIYVEPLKLQ